MARNPTVLLYNACANKICQHQTRWLERCQEADVVPEPNADTMRLFTGTEKACKSCNFACTRCVQCKNTSRLFDGVEQGVAIIAEMQSMVAGIGGIYCICSLSLLKSEWFQKRKNLLYISSVHHYIIFHSIRIWNYKATAHVKMQGCLRGSLQILSHALPACSTTPVEGLHEDSSVKYAQRADRCKQ